MKKKPNRIEGSKADNHRDRRSFIKKLGMGVIARSAYTVISMTQFACKHEPIEPTFRDGY